MSTVPEDTSVPTLIETSTSTTIHEEEQSEPSSTPKPPKSREFHSKYWLSPEQMTKLGIPEHQHAGFRASYYQKCFGIETWYTPLASKTFRTVTLPFTIQEAKVVKAAFMKRKSSGKTWSPSKTLDWDALGLADFDTDSKTTLVTLSEKIQKVIDTHFPPSEHSKLGGCFMKLSTRSPKDVVVYDADNKEIQDLIKVEIDSDLEKFQKISTSTDDPSSSQASEEDLKTERNAILVNAFVKATNRALQVPNGLSALYLLVCSQRVFSDINRNLDYGEKHWDIQIILREWVDIVIDYPAYEFRCFVYEKKLNAITQYFDFIRYQDLVDNKETLAKEILSFFETIKNEIPHESFVIDFFAKPGGPIYVIELNPFHNLAGAGLFSWKEDRDIFMNGPFEMRVLEKYQEDPLEFVPNCWEPLLSEYIASDPEDQDNSKCSLF